MNVSLTLELPPDAEDRIRAESPDLLAAVREGFLVNLFRRGILTHYELGLALGLDRFETDAVLKRHQVTEQMLTHEEIDADVASLKKLRFSRLRP